jgi:hypothetical protein
MTVEAGRGKLQIHKTSQGEITLFRFVGIIDEAFEGRALAKGLAGQLILSLDQIRRITSFGIRQWIDFIGRASEACSKIYFVDCAPRIVDQFNMVANFGGGGHILSFQAPFRCPECGNERLKLFQVDRDREMINALELVGDTCPNDGAKEVLDDDPETYLSYIGAQSPFVPDPNVVTFLAGRTSYDVPQGLRKARIEKRVEDRYTILTIAGDIGQDLPTGKLSEGLEGDVVFDLSGVSRVTPEGRATWRNLLGAVAPTIERLLVLGLPLPLLEGLSRPEDLAEKGQALTVMLPHMCPACSVTSMLEVDVARHYDTLKFASPPALSCPDCGGPVSCAASEAALNGLTQLPMPVNDVDVGELSKLARTPIQTTSTPRPVAPPPTTAARPGWATWLPLVAVALLGVGAALFFVLSKEADPTVAAPKVVETSHPKPPAWRDQTFTVKGDQILITGRSGFVPDKEQGFKRARAAALEELCHQVSNSIRDPVWVEHVGGQFQSFRAKAMGNLEKALVGGDPELISKSQRRVVEAQERVARAIAATASDAVSKRSQYYWEKLSTRNGVRYKTWSLFRVAKNEFRRLVEAFSQRGEALSALVVTFFPGMAWRYDQAEGAVIIALKPDSPLRHVGLLPGDLVLSAQERRVKDARSFRKVLTQEYEDLKAEGGTLLLQTKRGDGPVVAHRLMVARQPTAAGVPGKRRPRPKGKHGQPKPPPANIWDDNPYE